MSESKELPRLTPEEKERFQALRSEKERLFVFDDSFNYRPYLELWRSLRRLERFPKDWSKKAEKFLDYWEEAYTRPETTVIRLPAFALVDLFERSFLYFRPEVPVETKEKFARFQLEMITENKNEELKNILRGIWGYYVDPGRDLSKIKDETGISEREAGEKLRRTLASIVKKESVSTALAKRFSTLLAPDGRPNDEVAYFAGLYASDIRPLEFIAPGVLEHKIRRGEKEVGGKIITGIEMPPHIRLYTFEHANQLPRASTISKGRVEFYISADPEIIAEDRTANILADKLPAPILEHFINRMMRVRYTAEYKNYKNQPQEQKKQRRTAVGAFIEDLLNFDSVLWKELQNVMPADELLFTQKLLKKYDEEHKKDKEVPYLAFTIGFHLEKLPEGDMPKKKRHRHQR